MPRVIGAIGIRKFRIEIAVSFLNIFKCHTLHDSLLFLSLVFAGVAKNYGILLVKLLVVGAGRWLEVLGIGGMARVIAQLEQVLQLFLLLVDLDLSARVVQSQLLQG